MIVKRNSAISNLAAVSICAITLIVGIGLTGVILNAENSQNQPAPSTTGQAISTTTVVQGAPAVQSGVSQEGYATPVCNGNNGNTKITLVAEQKKVQIANNVTYDGWSFNGTIPGPTIWVNMCENVEFTLINNDSMAHSIDFHAAQVNWATVYAPVAPGKSLSFNFTPSYPGIFMYHCGVPPVLEHIANGMYGVIIVNGTGNWALPQPLVELCSD